MWRPVMSMLINGGVLYMLTLLVGDIQYTGGLKFFVVGGLILGFIDFIVRPAIKILSLPLVIITGGIFLIVINVFVLWFLSYFLNVADFMGISLIFPNWESYVIGAIVLGIINWTVHLIVK
ncbi:MAG: phage holin family protein [Candidatus Peregrinibacteria bacterium]